MYICIKDFGMMHTNMNTWTAILLCFFVVFFYFSSNALREYYVHLHCVWGGVCRNRTVCRHNQNKGRNKVMRGYAKYISNFQ